jgi:hypothetical protein
MRKPRNNGGSLEIVMYGYESSATLTTDRLHYNLQTRPIVRDGALRQRVKQFSCKTKGKIKIRSWAPKRCPTQRRTDWLIVSRKVTSTSTLGQAFSMWTVPMPDKQSVVCEWGRRQQVWTWSLDHGIEKFTALEAATRQWLLKTQQTETSESMF